MKPKTVTSFSIIPVIGLVSVFVIGWFVYTKQTQSNTTPQSFLRNQSPVSQQIQPTPSSVLGTSDGSVTTVGAKEIFIPFGYGTLNNATDWKDVPGMRATINSFLYPSIKQVVFEVTPRINDDNQTVSVRMRNNDGYSYPAVSMNGVGPDLRLSATFSLSPGEKTYYIQAKSTAGSPITIHQARLHIITY